jgi:hypothetical protein
MGYELFTTNVDPGKHAGGVEREKRSFKNARIFFPKIYFCPKGGIDRHKGSLKSPYSRKPNREQDGELSQHGFLICTSNFN